MLRGTGGSIPVWDAPLEKGNAPDLDGAGRGERGCVYTAGAGGVDS